MLVGAMYYFHEIYWNDLPGNAPLSESDFLEPIKIFKMTFPPPPQANGPPPLTGNKQPNTWSNSFPIETKPLS